MSTTTPTGAPERDGGPSAGRTPPAPLAREVAERLRRTPDGLVAAVVQQHGTGEVLMLAWMDDAALAETLTSGRATYWSRSRGERWRKGDTSGHVQHVRSVSLDCDGDALLVVVDQVGPACHTGTRSCFDGRDLDVLTATGPTDTTDPSATDPAPAAPPGGGA